MQAAAYVRVSSRSQNEAMQVDAIDNAARLHGDQIAEWFTEKQSGKNLDRPELARLREQVRRREIGRVYLFRIDRLTRSGIRDTLTILEEFRATGCRVISTHDGFDINGPMADVVIAVMAWAAQMERLALRERIAAARARIEASGGKWGRPARVSPELVGAIRERGRRGQTVRDIAMALKIPKSTVGKVLSQNGAYAGRLAKEFDLLKNSRLADEDPPFGM